jgi:hypothetical protein
VSPVSAVEVRRLADRRRAAHPSPARVIVAHEVDQAANPTRGSETVTHSMLPEIGAMRILKAPKR